jgi:Zn-dependent protease with chaperone function
LSKMKNAYPQADKKSIFFTHPAISFRIKALAA